MHLRDALGLRRLVTHSYRGTRAVVYRLAARYQFLTLSGRKCDQCWCGGALLPFEWHKKYGVCAECGCYVNRWQPLPEELRRLYSFDAYWHTRRRLKGHPQIEQRPANDRSDGRVKFWIALIERYGPPIGQVVEVGCAPGILIGELSDRGYDCIGVEPDERSAQWVTRNSGVEVRAGLFPGVGLPKCDLFLAFDVIEHSLCPEAFARKASDLLRPGGVAIIQTPIDRYSFSPPFGAMFHAAFDEVEHLCLFTDAAMQRLAERTGLSVVSLGERLWLHHEVCVLVKPATEASG